LKLLRRQLAAVVGHIAHHGHLVIARDHSVTTFKPGQFEITVGCEKSRGRKRRFEFHGFENHLPTSGEAGTIAVDNLTAHGKSRLRIAAAGYATKTEEQGRQTDGLDSQTDSHCQ
jgi:hypothetical protein